MKNKSLQRLGLITNNTIRQIVVSLFGMVIPFLVIHFSSKGIWGSFVSVFLFSLIALQFINWGNKEYLLRKFSENPSKIAAVFSENIVTRFPLLALFSIAGFFLFPVSFGFWIAIWLLGRYWNQSIEALILYQKEFNNSMIIEMLSFISFGISFYFLKSEITFYSLVIIYSSYQFFKGLLYILLFKRFFLLQKAVVRIEYFKASFSFFLLSVLGFLGSKADVYIIEHFGNQIITAEYQIINSLLVFVMSVTAFIYSPFTKMLYRNTNETMDKTKKTLALLGLLIVPVSLLAIHFILKFYLKVSFNITFYIVAFLYVYPSYLYGLDIVNLFKKHQEKIVVRYLFLAVLVNSILSFLFLYFNFGIIGALSGSAIAQLFVLALFKSKSYREI